MLFVSDLDQTLIYSKRFTQEPDIKNKVPVRLIETKDEEEISFMTENAIHLLKELASKLTFVPVTTRTIEQYTRISLFRDEVIPKYAVVSNGGNIFIDGKLSTDWNQIITKKLQSECLGMEDILCEFDKIQNNQWILSRRTADELFSYCIIDVNHIPHEELSCFEKWLQKQGWTLSLQGRKLYFVPGCVSKRNAITYIRDISGIHTTLAAGDSLLDLCMLEWADYSFAPSHGELLKNYKRLSLDLKKLTFTKVSGMLASEEILQNVAALVRNNG